VFGLQVVDRNTGRLNVPGEIFLPMDGCDHQTICKFADAKSENYLNLLARIENIYREREGKTHSSVSDFVKKITKQNSPGNKLLTDYIAKLNEGHAQPGGTNKRS
jgi:hypothetical protein